MPRFAEGALDANLAVVEVVRRSPTQRDATPAQVALAWLRYRADELRRRLGRRSPAPAGPPASRRTSARWRGADADQLDALDAAAAAVSGNRFDDLSWVSAGRE